MPNAQGGRGVPRYIKSNYEQQYLDEGYDETEVANNLQDKLVEHAGQEAVPAAGDQLH
jgi:hypothetical protein